MSRLNAFWQPDFVILSYEGDDEDSAREAGFIDENGESQFDEGWAMDKLGISAEELKKKFRVFRPRRRQ